MSAAGNTARAAAAHPLRNISFGDPAVSIERRGDGTIYPLASPIACTIGPKLRPIACSWPSAPLTAAGAS
jgi:hypothetical protein